MFSKESQNSKKASFIVGLLCLLVFSFKYTRGLISLSPLNVIRLGRRSFLSRISMAGFESFDFDKLAEKLTTSRNGLSVNENFVQPLTTKSQMLTNDMLKSKNLFEMKSMWESFSESLAAQTRILTNNNLQSKNIEEIANVWESQLKVLHSSNLLPILEKQVAFGLTYSELGAAAMAGIILFFLVRNVLKRQSEPLPTTYRAADLEAYYSARPFLLSKRAFSTAVALFENATPILLDYFTGKFEENAPKRAEKVKDTLVKFGAVYIKLGQISSVRPDLFPEAYIKELQKLQDQVAPFSSEEARQILKNELGREPSEVFEDIKAFDATVAAASLGQVYKANLKDGTTVAVKVQRPDMLESVTLDLFVTRQFLLIGAFFPKIKDTCLSLVAVIDAYAMRFIEELDYLQEAQNSKQFAEGLAKCTTVRDVTITPKVFDELTTRYLLTTEWIDGKRLSSIDVKTEQGKQQVLTVVNTLLCSYLTQLLETGFLHADPHPGNFLLTPDGRVCILDYGLMTFVEEDRRLAIIEYTTHFSAKDFGASLTDLTTLGFIPKEIAEDPERKAIVAPLLASVFRKLSEGGTEEKPFTVADVGDEIEALSKQYPITIPDYCGLIARAFSSLEGIGLSADPDFSLVKSCFPYLCRRLLTDDSPRIRAMLRTWVYGSSDYLDIDRVDELIEGFRTFTLIAKKASTRDAGRFNDPPILPDGTALSVKQSSSDEILDPASLDALNLLFSKEGNYVQDIVVEELVRLTNAFTRDTAAMVVNTLKAVVENKPAPSPRFASSLLSLLAPSTLLNFLRGAPLPRAQLLRLVNRLSPLVRLSNEDEETLQVFERMLGLVRSQLTMGETPTVTLSPREVFLLLKLLSTVRPGVQLMFSKFVEKLTIRTVQRLSMDLSADNKSGLVRREITI